MAGGKCEACLHVLIRAAFAGRVAGGKGPGRQFKLPLRRLLHSAANPWKSKHLILGGAAKDVSVGHALVHFNDIKDVRREWLAGRDLGDNSTAAEEIVAISSGPLEVNVSTGTGRLLSLTSKAGLLSASLNSEVGCHRHPAPLA